MNRLRGLAGPHLGEAAHRVLGDAQLGGVGGHGSPRGQAQEGSGGVGALPPAVEPDDRGAEDHRLGDVVVALLVGGLQARSPISRREVADHAVAPAARVQSCRAGPRASARAWVTRSV